MEWASRRGGLELGRRGARGARIRRGARRDGSLPVQHLRGDPAVVGFARRYRDYGKPAYRIHELTSRMSAFTAAIRLVQIERLDDIATAKNEVARAHLDTQHATRLEMPERMVSALYKYIVFE